MYFFCKLGKFIKETKDKATQLVSSDKMDISFMLNIQCKMVVLLSVIVKF